MPRNSARLMPAAVVALAMAMAGCSPPPEVPPIDAPPEPQAGTLDEAIQAPLEQARAVEDSLQRGADAQRRAIDDAAP